MDESQLDELFNNVKEKIGEENYALISDDVLNIRSGLITQINNSKEKDNKISELEKKREELLIANGNLFQKIQFDQNQANKSNDNSFLNNLQQKEEQKIELSDFIDEKGGFINAK